MTCTQCHSIEVCDNRKPPCYRSEVELCPRHAAVEALEKALLNLAMQSLQSDRYADGKDPEYRFAVDEALAAVQQGKEKG